MASRAWIAVVLLLVACGGPANSSVSQSSPSPQPPGPRADTWAWDGVAWQPAAGARPSARYAAALAYDAQHRNYVLFGGQTKRGSSDETWLWSAGTWTLASPAHKPTARRNPAMAYDPEHKMVVLYGGLVQNQAEGDPVADTWGWDGSDWAVLNDYSDTAGQRLGAGLVTAGSKVVL